MRFLACIMDVQGLDVESGASASHVRRGVDGGYKGKDY